MFKRLLPTAALLSGLIVLSASPVAAEGCNSLLVSCTSTDSSSQPSQASQPASSPQPSSPQRTSPGMIGDDPAAASRILQLVNKERANSGLGALELRGAITSIAAGHSRNMAGRRDIWHNDAYFTASTRSSLQAKALGENVALNGSIDDAHRRLMASPGHRANILNGNFDAVGIAVAHDEQGTLYVTQNFVDSATAATAAPRAAAPAKPAPARPTVAPAPAPRKAPPAPPAASVQHVVPAELNQIAPPPGTPVVAGDEAASSMVLSAASALAGLGVVGLLIAVTRVLG